MAAPSYNCPFSAGGTVKTCTAVRGSNTNAGCPFYNTVAEDCSAAQIALRMVRIRGGETPAER